MEQQEWLSSLEAAEMMGCSRTFIQSRCHDGYLKSKIVHHKGRPGRGTLYVLRSDVEDRLKRPVRYRWQSESAAETHYVTQEKAIEILGISYGLLQNMVREGKLTQLTKKPVPVEERVLHHKAYFRRHEVEMLAKLRAPAEQTVEQIAYFAGLIDGEGSIGIYASRTERPGARKDAVTYTMQLSMGNTCLELIQWVHTTFGGGAPKLFQRRDGWADCFYWIVQGDRAAHLLQLVLPYLIAKKKQALLAIEFRNHVRDYAADRWRPVSLQERQWREQKSQEIKALNGRFRAATAERRLEISEEMMASKQAES